MSDLSSWALRTLFSPVRKNGQDPRPDFPYPGHARVSPQGFERRIRLFVQTHGAGALNTRHPFFIEGLSNLMGPDILGHIQVLLRHLPAEAIWSLSLYRFNAITQTLAKKQTPTPLLTRVFETVSPETMEAPALQNLAAMVAEALPVLPTPLPGSESAWATIFRCWLAQGEEGLPAIEQALQKRPELIYAHAVHDVQKNYRRIREPEDLPVLLMDPKQSPDTNWARWVAWGGEPMAENGPTTVRGRAIPEAWHGILPAVPTVAMACVQQGQAGARHWLQRTWPDLAEALDHFRWHDLLTRPDSHLQLRDELCPSLETLLSLPEEVWHGSISPLWTLLEHNPHVLVRPEPFSNEPRPLSLLDCLQQLNKDVRESLTSVRDGQGHDLWWLLLKQCITHAADEKQQKTIQNALLKLLEMDIPPRPNPDHPGPLLLTYGKHLWKAYCQSRIPMLPLWSKLIQAYPEAFLGQTDDEQREVAQHIWQTPTEEAPLFKMLLEEAQDHMHACLYTAWVATIAHQTSELQKMEACLQNRKLDWPDPGVEASSSLQREVEVRHGREPFVQMRRSDERQQFLLNATPSPQRRRLRG